MVTLTYTYSLSSNFGGNLNTAQLHEEIKNEPSITTTCVGVNNPSDDVNILFNGTLSAAEESTLSSLISSHTPDTTPPLIHSITSYIDKSTNETSYERLGTIIFPGATHCRIKVQSFMDTGVTSYTIKIHDMENYATIIEKTYSNTEEVTNNMGLGSNVPSNEVTFEVFVKKTGGDDTTFAYIEMVKVEHD